MEKTEQLTQTCHKKISVVKRRGKRREEMEGPKILHIGSKERYVMKICSRLSGAVKMQIRLF